MTHSSDSVAGLVDDQTEVLGWQVNLGQSAVSFSVPRGQGWWTGKEPRSCPGIGADGKLHGLSSPNLANCTRQDVQDYFDNGWTLTELMFSGLVSEEAFYRPPYHELRHPLIFYFVHPAVFFVNKLRLAGLVSEPVDAYFEGLFDVGVDEMSWDDMSKNYIQWPSVDACIAYRARVYEVICRLIEGHPALSDGHGPVTMDDPLWALFMGLEHERIHIETSSCLIRELPIAMVIAPPEYPSLSPTSPEKLLESPTVSFVAVPAGSIEIGKSKDWPTYGWDNEYGLRKAEVSQFEASRALISNREFLDFVRDGGYRKPRYWSEEGFAWRSFRDIQHPSFWVAENAGFTDATFRLRTVFEEIEMAWNWPVVVNFHEAKAYAAWRGEQDRVAGGYRLPTEAEHRRMRQVDSIERTEQVEAIYNLSLRYGSESPVDAGGVESGSFRDLFGNVWQWMEDHFYPLEGFKTHEYYDDFSTPCFDGRHHMILGGSFISIGDEASVFARFHFRPHFFQHAGIRLVKSGGDGALVRLDRFNS